MRMMNYFNEVNFFYACLILLVKVEKSLYSAVMDTKSSIFSHGIIGSNNLDICGTKNQHGFGRGSMNSTRHHKGHRRRTMTQSNYSADITTAASAYILSSVTTYPLRTPEAMMYSVTRNKDDIDRIFEYEKHEVRHKSKHRERLKEVIQEEQLIKLNVAKKDIKGSSYIGKKINGKDRVFLTENCTTVVAQIGTTATLHCEVSDITENTVTWIRKKDYSLLSVGLVTYSTDNRFLSAHGRHVKDWALHIRFASPTDAGYYECQVPTHPPTSIFFKLLLVAAYAEIVGESEKIIREGSMLRLVCVVKGSTEPPSYVFWYFGNRMINYDLNGVNVRNGRQTSELRIGKAELRHGGNYTCVPANAKSASVTVHVIQNETPAAMQHDKSSAVSNPTHQLGIFVILCIAIALF